MDFGDLERRRDRCNRVTGHPLYVNPPFAIHSFWSTESIAIAHEGRVRERLKETMLFKDAEKDTVKEPNVIRDAGCV